MSRYARFIYFARVAGSEGPIKIGCSSCPLGRCKQLGFDLAVRIDLIASAPGDHLLERNLHLKFADHKAPAPSRTGRSKPIPGATEWFAPVPELLSLIETASRTGRIELSIEDCRERAIAARYKAGETLQQISESYGITRERVRQILASIGIERRSPAERAYMARLERQRRFAEWQRRLRAAA
jgi:hypothetical protein